MYFSRFQLFIHTHILVNIFFQLLPFQTSPIFIYAKYYLHLNPVKRICYLRNCTGLIKRISRKNTFSFFKKFYWSTVDLQCDDNFCYTTTWFSYTHIRIHSVSDITEYWLVPYAIQQVSISDHPYTIHIQWRGQTNHKTPIHSHATPTLAWQLVSLVTISVFLKSVCFLLFHK